MPFRRIPFTGLVALVSGLLILPPTILYAQKSNSAQPEILKKVGFEQNLNAQLPMDVPFLDENGTAVQLGQYFRKNPVVLAFVYYKCPMLCPMTLEGIMKGLKQVTLDMSTQYEVVMISIDPKEGPPTALTQKKKYAEEYGRPGAAQGMHFLTGSESNIRKVANIAGFHYQYDISSGQYAHAAGLMIATPEGKLSRYFYGIVFSPTDLRLGLVEASSRHIGNPVDAVLLYCCKYDATTGKYDVLIGRILQLAGIFIIVVIGGLFLILHRKVRRNRSRKEMSVS